MSVVLLTGATGFVGKVVLEELLRRSSEHALDAQLGRVPNLRYDD